MIKPKNAKLTLGDRLSFGQHKGRLVKDVLIVDAGYLRWLINRGIVCFTKHANKVITM